MKHVTALVSALVIACGASTAPPAPSSSKASQSRIERIERGILPAVRVNGEDVRFSLEQRMRERKVPAVSIAVIEDYELQWAKAYGLADVEAGARADEETTFLAGSISKSINALGVLLAVADGTLALDKPINEQLESWKLPDNELTRATPVTLRQLLSHTAGTTVHGFPGYQAGKPVPTIQQILDGEQPANTAAIRVDLAPGTKFRYSGGGTTISHLALTERSRKPYPQVLAERVLGPLGMVHSSYDQVQTPDRLKHAAAGYRGDGTPVPGKRQVYPEMAAAGLWTTPSDLARAFIEIALARAGKPSKVPREIAMQMTTKVIDIEGAPGQAVGLGVFLMERNGAKLFGHDGADQGFRAMAVISLDGGHGVVVMTNSDNGSRLLEDIERSVFVEYGWPGVDPAITRVALDPAQRAKLVGRYLGSSPAEIADAGDQLTIRFPFEQPIELVPTGPGTVVQRDSGRRYVLDANGDLDSTLHNNTGRLERVAGSARHHLFELEAGRFDDAVASWRERVKTTRKLITVVEETDANNLGYQLLDRDPPKGVELLRLVATVFPDSSNAHDSLGEAYARTGDKARAIEQYELAVRTLDADTRVSPADRVVRRAHAEAQLAKLKQP